MKIKKNSSHKVPPIPTGDIVSEIQTEVYFSALVLHKYIIQGIG